VNSAIDFANLVRIAVLIFDFLKNDQSQFVNIVVKLPFQEIN